MYLSMSMCGKIKNKREKKMTILVVFAFRLFCFSNTFAAQPLFFFYVYVYLPFRKFNA